MRPFHTFLLALAFVVASAAAVKAFTEAEAMEVFEDADIFVEEVAAEDEDEKYDNEDDFLGVDGVHLLERKGDVVRFKEASYDELQIMCHKGYRADMTSFWSSSTFRLQIDTDDYEVFLGRNVSAVNRLYDAHKSTWFYSGLPWKTKDVKLNPFEKSCVGVVTREKYSVVLHMYHINYWQVMMTAAGILAYLYAPRLCRNVFFHYTTGIAAGVLMSLLVMTYFLQKRFRAGWFGWIMACYSLSLYFLTSLWYNLKVYLLENHLYVLCYFVVTGLASFAFCYRMGPVENPRTLNLIQWTLQLFALVLVYLSSYYQLASFSLALVFVTYKSVPDLHKAKFQTWYYRRFFRPQIRLLNESEYFDQSRIHTEKELEKLRVHCQSPKCDQWKTISSLNSPSRFAEFVKGSPHLTSEEVLNYSHVDDDFDQSGANEASMTDDESSDEDFTENGEIAERLRILKS